MVNTIYFEPKFQDSITFSRKDLEGVNFPHSDEVIIKVIIVEADVRHLLVDNGNSGDILYLNAFMNIGLKPSYLQPCSGSLVRFISHEVPFIGLITLPLTLVNGPPLQL